MRSDRGSALLVASGIAVGYESAPVLDGVDFAVHAGECVGVIGPNGSGKSTLLKALSGVLPVTKGSISLNQRPLAAIPRRELARWIAGVPAELHPAFAFQVADVVAMGRHPYLGLFSDLGRDDRAAVATAMHETGIELLAGRSFDALSSGERQRVALAQALAQEPRVLLLDEPTAHLDLSHATHFLDLLKELQRDRGLAVVLVSHDLDLAAEYADRLVLLHDGRVRAEGAPDHVFDYRVLEQVYGTVVVVETNRVSGRPRVVPVSKWSLEKARGQE